MSSSRDSWPHVTDIIKSAGLIDTTWFTDEGRDRGTALHMACALAAEGDLDWSSVDDDTAARTRQFLKFLEDTRSTVLLPFEIPVENPVYRYCGTLDCIIEMEGRKNRLILDMKRGADEPASHGPQLAAYQKCYTVPMDRANLYLQPNSYKFIERKGADDWKIFTAALSLHYWKVRHGLEG